MNCATYLKPRSQAIFRHLETFIQKRGADAFIQFGDLTLRFSHSEHLDIYATFIVSSLSLSIDQFPGKFRKSNDNIQQSVHQPLCPGPHGKQQWWCEDAMTHWAAIGPDWSRDLNTGLWLDQSGDIPLFLPRLLSPLCRCQQCQWGVIVSLADRDTQELQIQRQTTTGPVQTK